MIVQRKIISNPNNPLRKTCERVMENYISEMGNLNSSTKYFKAALHSEMGYDRVLNIVFAEKWDAEKKKLYAEFFSNKNLANFSEVIAKLKELMKKYKVADCGEHTPCFKYNLAENGIASEVIDLKVLPKENVVGIKRYYVDHSILLIDRKKDSNLQDYRDWGENALIGDAHCGKIFTVEEGMAQYMDDFKFSPDKDKFVFSIDHYQETENELNEIIRKANKNKNL